MALLCFDENPYKAQNATEVECVMSKIKFSIIVAVYNTVCIDGENMLIKCLDSLIQQSYENIEIILVDDGSTDEAAGLCDEYADMDSRIVVIHKDNEGAGEARNTGLRKATGDYVFFVDSDDTIKKQSCDVFWDIIQKYPGIDIIASDYEMIEKRKRYYRRFSKLVEQAPMNGQDFMVYQFKSYSMYTGTGNHIIKLSFIYKYNLFFDKNLSIAEDLEWGPRLYMHANSVMTSNFAHYDYYIGHTSRGAPEDAGTKYAPMLEMLYNLEKEYDRLPPGELRLLLKNYLVQIYYIAINMGKFYKKPYRHLFDADFIIRNRYLKKTKNVSYKFFLTVKYFIPAGLVSFLYGIALTIKNIGKS
jgi:glycosyltransferase involved in cell wall biosynthesis